MAPPPTALPRPSSPLRARLTCCCREKGTCCSGLRGAGSCWRSRSAGEGGRLRSAGRQAVWAAHAASSPGQCSVLLRRAPAASWLRAALSRASACWAARHSAAKRCKGSVAGGAAAGVATVGAAPAAAGGVAVPAAGAGAAGSRALLACQVVAALLTTLGAAGAAGSDILRVRGGQPASSALPRRSGGLHGRTGAPVHPARTPQSQQPHG